MSHPHLSVALRCIVAAIPECLYAMRYCHLYRNPEELFQAMSYRRTELFLLLYASIQQDCGTRDGNVDAGPTVSAP
jgi:hypothetical protein